MQLIGVTGGGSLVCCICLVWWVHAFYRVLRKHFRTKAEEAREEEERKERQVRRDRNLQQRFPHPPHLAHESAVWSQEMKSYGDGTDPRIDTGDIEEQQVAQHRRDRSRSGMVVARLKGLTKSPRLCAATSPRCCLRLLPSPVQLPHVRVLAWPVGCTAALVCELSCLSLL